jgi:hypothetical protein
MIWATKSSTKDIVVLAFGACDVSVADLLIVTFTARAFVRRLPVAFSALIAADTVLIPFDCDTFARQALYQVLAQVADLQADHNESLVVEGIVINHYSSTTGGLLEKWH